MRKYIIRMLALAAFAVVFDKILEKTGKRMASSGK